MILPPLKHSNRLICRNLTVLREREGGVSVRRHNLPVISSCSNKKREAATTRKDEPPPPHATPEGGAKQAYQKISRLSSVARTNMKGTVL